MRNILITLWILFAAIQGVSQGLILEDHNLQYKVEKCLSAAYNFNFTEANSLHKEIEQEIAGHPMTPFLKALIIYWENFPLLPEDSPTDEFLASLEKSIMLAKGLLKDNPQSIEGVFFDLHSRAYMAMFWADNGRPAKVIMDIEKLYRRTMQGIEMKEEFNEFYFSSGLYSYYIDAYVEIHPVYKPISLLFRKGDKERGLREMQYAIDHTKFIKAESLFFMSLLQLNYEKKLTKALDYASELYQNYPENTYYIGHYLKVLLYSDEYSMAKNILQNLDPKKDAFSHMIYSISWAFVTENDLGKLKDARSLYLEGINLAEDFGSFADNYQAIAYAGLSRISEKRGNKKLEAKYRRKSMALSNYEFILNYE